MPIVDVPELRIDGHLVTRETAPGPLPDTDGWMHSGCAILDDGTVVVAHPQGRRLLFLAPSGDVRTVPVPALEMHTIFRQQDGSGETLWLVNNGHRFEKASPDYDHYRERGSVIRVDLDGTIVEELHCPALPAYAERHWQPTSICAAADGSLWVADGYETSLIHQYRDGHHVRTVDGVETGAVFDCPHGVAARGDQVLVADRTNRRIVVLEDGVPVDVLDAPLTSPSSLLVLGEWMLVTELFGGIAVFHRDEYVGHFARSTDDADRDAWPNDRDDHGNMIRPTITEELHSPHGIASDGTRIVITEWLIGGRLNQFRMTPG